MEGTPPPNANFRVIGPGYFETMQIPILRGRDIATSDFNDGEQVGLINRTMAELYWPGENPVGKQITLFSSDGPSFNIIGVVADIKQHSLSMTTLPEMYRPFEQWSIGRSHLIARMAGTPESVVPTLKGAIRSVNPNLPIGDIQTLNELLSTSTAESQYIAEITGIFSLLALMMGAIGVYGVTSYVVGRRTREIGIRMALGANRAQVLREVFRGSSKPVVVGLGIGLLAALGLGRLVESLLFEVSATNPSIFLGTAAVISIAAASASLIPARRASLVDPTEALRAE
jgi:putative ABC transport system permease protein